jgi:hypothetical protein
METVNKSDYTDQAVSRIRMNHDLVYQNKENRDKAFALVKVAGINAKKGSVTCQQLHPEYIEDYVGEIQTGFGNTMYEMFWAKLYKLEIKK